MRLLRWPGPEGAPRSRHPYRDAAVVYAGLAGLVVVGALVTGGSLVRAVVIAGFVYVVATAWTWFHLRRRDVEEEGG